MKIRAIVDWLGKANRYATAVYNAPYRAAIARAKRDEDDLFMLLVFSELMGVPNPASYYTLELQPLLLERFHEWHLRMGMEHSPLDGFRCC
ncbi:MULTISPECIES: cory-CC-star protein [Idiomarinaceae]|uniref:DNA helicase n=4 Tax=Pseudidiomarina TaxID=2800384 RepID=A0A368V1W2_9GAMM|nr:MULTISPECIES: cory-CC-star protein [Idiomarinaceae]MDT7524990.1 DNA helicase [Pseudidiomarina sp. GXY010]MDX1525026.1 cory-CC-star protein [Pseudidiomarina maritima]MRJ40752.1 DNA helicase [Idiomarina sp. FeN1]NCU56556.1 DNA helicase [Idiomarina sp. FenA--70]NCU58936.1 DNA helicase [Idiomarina sp. FenBw--71]